ncbi:hypothetical protein C0J52_20868 [Blattella germanica]|nr:hypothetical protein C0J52_20868 [Blattella germanica]
MGNPCSKNECLYYLCCHCCCPDAASHRRSGSSTNTLLTNVEHQAHTVPPSGRNEVFQLTDLNEIIIVPPSGSSQITHGTSSSRNIPTSDPFDSYVRSYKQSQFTPNVRTEPYDRQRKVYISSVQETEIASRDYYTLGIFRNDDLSIDEDAEEIITPKCLDDHNCNEQRNTEPILKGIEIIKSENREIVNGTEHVSKN